MLSICARHDGQPYWEVHGTIRLDPPRDGERKYQEYAEETRKVLQSITDYVKYINQNQRS